MRDQVKSPVTWMIAAIGFLMFAVAPVTADARDEAVTDQTQKAEAKKSGVQTEMKFDELLVRGKYHFADEAVVTVEEDKVLDALLGQRTDFKDRIKRSASRH